MAAIANHTGAKRKRDDDIQPLPKKVRKGSSDDGDSATPDTEEISGRGTAKFSSKHTKKERKTNRSSRIHSLKKLLSRDTLPSNIRQDKERELAALEYDQAKHNNKKQNKKVLEKYHYVRFVERQKAEKRLKQLRKLQQEAEEKAMLKIEQDIHEMEVNRNYAIYAPLHKKYVSVFVQTKGRSDVGAGNDKPDTWHEIEAAMQAGQSALEALRDGKGKLRSSGDSSAPSLQSNSHSLMTSVKPSKRASYVDSKAQYVNGRGKETAESDASEDEMNDGGFFQR